MLILQMLLHNLQHFLVFFVGQVFDTWVRVRGLVARLWVGRSASKQAVVNAQEHFQNPTARKYMLDEVARQRVFGLFCNPEHQEYISMYSSYFPHDYFWDTDLYDWARRVDDFATVEDVIKAMVDLGHTSWGRYARVVHTEAFKPILALELHAAVAHLNDRSLNLYQNPEELDHGK